MNTGAWFEEQLGRPDLERARILDAVETLEERQAIVDESREAEHLARVARAPVERDNVMQRWVREMYPDPLRMGKDLRWSNASQAEIAVLTSHLFQPNKKLDEAIKRTVIGDALNVDTSRRIFRKVPA